MDATPSRSVVARLTLLAVLAPLAPAACSVRSGAVAAGPVGGARADAPDATAAQDGPAAPAGCHLLDLLATARVAGDLRGLDGDRARSGEIVFADEFDAAPVFPWFDGEWMEEIEGDALRPRRARVGTRRDTDGGWLALGGAGGGLHAIVAAPEEAAFAVVARVRAPAGAPGAGLVATQLAARAPAAERLATTLLAVSDAERADGRRAGLPDDAAGAWRELELFVPPRKGRASLALSLLPSEAGLDVDRIELRRLTFPARVAASPRLACDVATHPLRRVVDLEHSVIDALLVPGGASVALDVEVPAHDARLRFVPGALAAREGERTELRVDADGRELWRGQLRARPLDAPAEVVPVTLALPELAGRRVELVLRATAGGDALAWFGAPELLGARAGPRRRNLLLISLDTTRADLLGCYGSERGLTPRLDAFAAQGTRFADVVAPSCWTLPTHMSLLTGQHPILHGMIASPRMVDPVRSRLLGLRLREQGWCTAAFTAGGPMVPRNGFGLGFDFYGTDDPCGLTKYNHFAPDQVAARASDADPLAPTLEWLRAHADQPFFLFVHTFFVHNYFPHREWLERVADPDAVVAGDQPLVMAQRAMEGDRRALQRLRDLYAATLLEVDGTLIQRLLGELDALRLADDTIVCILSDHGEEHLEHGQFGHRLELFRESTRVPWLLRGPGIPAGVVRDEPVALADVSATLAGLLGLPPEPLDFGRDRFAAHDAAVAGDAEPDPARLLVFGGLNQPGSREALEVGPWKVMRWRAATHDEDDVVRIYRIDVDPGETRDLAQEDPARRAGLLARLERELRALEQQAATLPGSNVLTRELTPAELERLRGLGYAE